MEPLRQAVRTRYGAYGKAIAGLALRHDHGSQYVSKAFRRELRFLDIEGSPAPLVLLTSRVATGSKGR